MPSNLKKAVLSCTVLILAIATASLFGVLHISQTERMQFTKLLEQAKAHTGPSAQSHLRSAQQKRLGVRKDLWITQSDGKRTHDKIESISSLLTLTPIEGHLDVVEHLQQINCSMQDKLFQQDGNLFQNVRMFKAASGTYRHSTGRFTAESVSLALFRLPGETLPLSLTEHSPYLKGMAQEVSFAVSGKASQFQASRFKATLSPKQEKAP